MAKRAQGAEPERVAAKEPLPKDSALSSDSLEDETNQILQYIGGRALDGRKRMGLKQSELADRAGLAVGTMFLIEQGRQNLTVKTLVALAQALDCDLHDLLPRDQDGLPSGGTVRACSEGIRQQLAGQREQLARQDLALKQVEFLLSQLDGLETE